MVRIFLIALSLLAMANPQGLVGGVIRGSGGASACSGLIGTQTAYTTSISGSNAYHMLTYFPLGCSGNPTSINATVGSGEFVLSIYECSQSAPGEVVDAGDLIWQSSQIDETNTSPHTISAAITGVTLPETPGICLGISSTVSSTSYREDTYASANIGLSYPDGTSGVTVPALPNPWTNTTTYQRRRTVWITFD